MNILSITAQKPDSTGSGVYLTELIKSFQKGGHQQALVAGITQDDTIHMPEEVAVYPVYYQSDNLPFPIAGMSDEMPYESTRYSDMTDAMFLQFENAFLTQIRCAIQEFHPDFILCHHLYFLTALIQKEFYGIPIYAICHGSDLRQLNKNPKKRDFILSQIPRLNGIFALHEQQFEQICTLFHCEPSKVHILGTGYNSDIFSLHTNEPRNSNPLSLLFAGKISEKKGIKSLLHSLSYIDKPLTLSLAGGYGNKDEFHSIQTLANEVSQKNNIQIQFLGKLNHFELAQEMNRNQIFILPSFYEGLPLVIMEALACGMKVICTDLPGIKPWMDCNLPKHNVVFVTPPKMQNEDEPIANELLPFEQRLSLAIQETAAMPHSYPNHISELSWDGLTARILAYL